MSSPRLAWSGDIAPALRGGATLLISLAVALAGAGCGKEIGSSCETSLDCSSQGSRLCDRTQPHGYCTLRGCEKGTCPEESVCVKFRPEQERLAVTYCMYECEEDDDCRDDEGYQCAGERDFGAKGEAEVLDSDSKRFCVANPRTPVDAGALMSMPPPELGGAADSSTGSADAGLDGAVDAGSVSDAGSDGGSTPADANVPDGF